VYILRRTSKGKIIVFKLIYLCKYWWGGGVRVKRYCNKIYVRFGARELILNYLENYLALIEINNVKKLKMPQRTFWK
jgi:hypothetical protein